MSSSDDNKKKFEIIKVLWSTVAIRKKSTTDFKEIAQITNISEHEITGFLRILHNAGYVKTQYIPSAGLRTAYLTEKSFNSMDKTPQPKTYDELISRVDNPQQPFGVPVVIPLSRGEKFKKWIYQFWKIITKIGIIIGIIAGGLAILKIFGLM